MDVTLPNGRTLTGVPDGTTKAEVMQKAVANGLATQSDFDVANHTAPYARDIAAVEQANNLPSGLLSALISKESSGNPNAISSAGAIGLGQTLPTTLADMGYDEQQVAENPQLQIQAAGQYLSQMLQATNGDVGRALTAYHSGLSNLAKYESGERQMGPAARGYATDERFSRFVNAPPADPQAQQNAAVFAQGQQIDQPLQTPAPGTTITEDITQAGKGILQAGANVANIPGSVVNTALGAAGVPNEYQVATLQLPESLRPTDPYAQIGAEIGPYLIPVPGLQAESLATTVAKGADALIPRIAGIIERNVPQSIAENTVGALAQNASSGNQNGFGADIAADTGASLAVRAALPAVSRVAQVVRDARQGQAAATQGAARPVQQMADAPAGLDGFTDNVDMAAQGPVPLRANAAGVVPAGAAPSSAPATAIDNAAGASAEEEALRQMALRNPDPNLASSLDGLNIQPRAEVQQAAGRLGMADDLLPSHLSGNEQYQAVEQAIKSRPGSGLKVQEDAAIDRLANRAGQMIDQMAGGDSSLALSTRFNTEMEQRMGALERRSNQLYKQVDEAMAPSTPVDAVNTARLVDRLSEDLGGWENLGSVEKKVFQAVNPAGEKLPSGEIAPGVLTYANLNRVRQDVGAALYKQEGVYKDGNRALLSRIYGALSEDQRSVLGSVGARRDFEVANRLVAMRKSMEDNMVSLRGRDLSGDVTRRASLAISGMARGDTAQFRRLFEGNAKKGSKSEKPLVQTRAHRQQLIASAIGEQLSAGRRGTAFNPAGFADWYDNLRRNGGLNLIAKHMPGSFMAQLRDLHTVADAIRGAKAKEITTGRLNDFTRRFERVNRAAQLVADNATKAGAAIGGLAGPVGAAAGVAAGGRVAQVAERLGGAEAGAAAEKLLSSPAYQAQVRRLASADPANVETVVTEVNQKIKQIPAYRELLNSLPRDERVRLARLGLIGWVNSDQSEQ